MLAAADREKPVDTVATAKDIARTENREVKDIDTLHYFVVFMLKP